MAPESGGRARRDSSRGMPGLGSRDAPVDPQEPRVFPLPPTLREGTARGRDVADARTWAGASCRSTASSRRRSRGLMVPAGAARRGRPHRPSRAAREAAAARAPWRGPGRGGRGPGAGGGSSAAPSRALGAGSATQRSGGGGGGGRRSRAGGRPVVAADGGGGGGPGPGWRAGGSCDPDTRSPPGRGAGAGRGRGGEAAGGARPLRTHLPPPSRRCRGKGMHRPGGRAPGLPPPKPGGRGRGGGRWACRREPDESSENHFIARVLGRGASHKGAPCRPHPRRALQGEPLRGPGARSRGLGAARVVAAAAASAAAPAGVWLCWPCRKSTWVVGTGILGGGAGTGKGGQERARTDLARARVSL